MNIPPTYLEKKLETKIEVQNKNKNKQTNNTIDMGNEIYIDKQYEQKNTYLNKNGKNITDNPNIWQNWNLNKGLINIRWDNKVNIFQLEFGFIDNHSVNNIAITLNNEKTFSFRPINERKNDLFWTVINSLIFTSEYKNFNNIKSLQIKLENNNEIKLCNFIFKSYDSNKTDFLLKQNVTSILNFQNLITIRGEEIKNYYSSIEISPMLILQGKWNSNFLKLKCNDDIFFRNAINEKISISNIPISQSNKATLELSLTKVNEDNCTYVSFNKITYYDLKKKETIKGFGMNCNSGYIVPFEFSGVFFPTLNIQINNISFTFSWKENFEKPYFKQNEGIRKIHMQTSYFENQESNWIPISNSWIIEAEKYNFTFDEFINWLQNYERL